MRIISVCAALCAGLLLAAPASSLEIFKRWWAPLSTRALECDNLKDLQDIVQAAARGGTDFSTQHYKQINASAPAGKKPCRMVWLSPLLQLKAIEGYPLVEFPYNQLRDVVLLEVKGWGGKARYAVIDRFAFKGNAI